MKERIFRSAVLIFCLALGATGYASTAVAQQAINFSERSYKEALAAAKTSHKKVFVDAFATWCAPCKALRHHTFKDPKAAAYFNKHFINVSIDVEKGEGIALAKQWQVDGLPTLLIVDEKGEVLANHTGFVDGNGLMAFAKEAMNGGQEEHSSAGKKH